MLFICHSWFGAYEELLTFSSQKFAEIFIFFIFVRLPFEWRTPFGYLIAYFIQFPCAYFQMLVAACSLNILIGSCRILMSFVKDIENDLYSFNKNTETKLNRAELKVQLNEFIEFHVKIKQLRT